ncbi:MAG TPA: GAF domain-containing protein [Pyrinomonadaceae bacterium]
MVSEELEKSLRAELNDHVNMRMSGIQEEVARLQSQVNEAFTRILERSTSQGETDTSLAVSIAEHIRAAHERGIEEAAAESARTKASSDLAILKAAVEEIDDQRTQAGILDSLVNRAASFAPRVAFFVIKNEQATGWRGRGFEGTVGDERIREISLPLAADTLVGDVARSRTTWSGSPGANAEDHTLLGQLGSEPPQRMIAIPLVVRDKTVAVLYADSAALESDAVNLEALETLVRVAGMAVELLSLSRNAARPQRTRAQASAPSTQFEEPSAQQPEAEAPVAEATEATPTTEAAAQPVEMDASMAMAETLPTEEPQVEEEQAPQAVEAEAVEPAAHDTAVAEEEPQAVEAAPVEAAPVEEEETPTIEATPLSIDEKGVAPYIPTAPAWADTGASTETTHQPAAEPAPAAAVDQYGARLGSSRRYGSTDAELPIEVSDDERRLHNDARRFARLLVSEIKLYNEQKVKEGRTQGNIYERLREDIDRSRQMYDKRVAPPVAARYDYFHQELVNTLAEGDPAKLGDAYPGAAVSA